MRKWWGLQTGVFLVVWVGLLAAGRGRFFDDPGTFWHTAVGERILATHAVPACDEYSYTRAGEPWAAYEWLGECGMALAHRVSGLDGLLLVTVTLLAGLYAWLAGRLARAGMHPLWAVSLTALAAGVGASHFHTRPHLVTILLQAVTVHLLSRCDAGTLPLRRLAWLVPVFVVWTNVHGGVLGGIGTVGLVAAGWWVAPLAGWESPVRGWRGRLFLVLLVAGCVLAVLVNPYGVEVPRTWMWIMRSPVLPRAIKEHTPLEWNTSTGLLVALLAAAYLAFLAGTWPRRPRVTWLLPLAWLYLGCERVRHAPLFAATAVIVMAEMLPYTRWRTRLAGETEATTNPGGGGWRWALVPAVAVVVALVLQVAGARVPLVGRGWARLDPGHWPVDLLPQLRRFEHAEPGGTRIFNEYALGGFLIYCTPGYRVFVDDRCEVYRDAWLDEFTRAERQDTDRAMRDWQARYGFDYALTWRGSRFDEFLRGSAGWEAVGETGAVRFYRRGGAGLASAR
jgi:hypothetical protein